MSNSRKSLNTLVYPLWPYHSLKFDDLGLNLKEADQLHDKSTSDQHSNTSKLDSTAIEFKLLGLTLA